MAILLIITHELVTLEQIISKRNYSNLYNNGIATSELTVDHLWSQFGFLHTDDCDMIGDNDDILMEVYNIVNKRWKGNLVDASFMLGIKRTIHETPQGMTVTMTMQVFIEGMASAFN